MKIYKLSNVVALPFALVLLYLLYQTFFNNKSTYITYALIPLIIVVLIYLFQPQINYWWINKFPPVLDDKLLNMLSQTNSKYNSMSDIDKSEFQKRLILYTEANEFIAKGMEQDFEIPYDVKHLISQIPITMMWHRKDRVLKAFERVVIYKHPFPSPKYKFLHTAETDIEDGVIIFCLSHAEKAFQSPSQYYNVAWHSYAEAFIKAFPNEAYPEVDNSIWQKIENISLFSEDALKGVLGFEGIDPVTVLVTMYFTHNSEFNRSEPELFIEMTKIFNPSRIKV